MFYAAPLSIILSLLANLFIQMIVLYNKPVVWTFDFAVIGMLDVKCFAYYHKNELTWASKDGRKWGLWGLESLEGLEVLKFP